MTETLITQAPIQARVSTLGGHERMFTLLASEALARAYEYNTESELPRIDYWNTHGHKIENEFRTRDGLSTYSSFIDQLIATRYETLEGCYGIPASNRKIVKDSDIESMQIVKKRVGELIKDGVFHSYAEKFSHCGDCNQTVAPIAVSVSGCKDCGANKLSEVTKVGLFMTISEEKKNWIVKNVKLSTRGSLQLLKSSLNTMPAMIQVSKQRRHGVILDDYGVDESFVLDPLIAVSMTRTVLRERGMGEVSSFVLGRDTLKNFVPHSLIVEENANVRYIATGLVPPFGNKDVTEKGAAFYFPFLALAMSDTAHDLGKNQLKAYEREFEKVQRKYQACKTVLGRLALNAVGEIIPLRIERFSEVGKLMANYKMREASLALRELIFADLSRDYIERCKDNATSPDPQIIKAINDVHFVLYGEI